MTMTAATGAILNEDLISVQNALNKAVVDLLEGSDKTAFQLITNRRREAGGLKVNPRQILYHKSADSMGQHPGGRHQ